MVSTRRMVLATLDAMQSAIETRRLRKTGQFQIELDRNEKSP